MLTTAFSYYCVFLLLRLFFLIDLGLVDFFLIDLDLDFDLDLGLGLGLDFDLDLGLGLGLDFDFDLGLVDFIVIFKPSTLGV